MVENGCFFEPESNYKVFGGVWALLVYSFMKIFDKDGIEWVS